MSEDLRAEADRRLEEVLAETGARDPREFYRTTLRGLRDANPGSYDEAVRHYRDVLLPRIAESGADPLDAWTEYGRTLAELSAPGRTFVIDPTGRALPYEAPPPRDALVLHLPENRRSRALLVALPVEPSAAQRATYDWLVVGRQRLRESPD